MSCLIQTNFELRWHPKPDFNRWYNFDSKLAWPIQPILGGKSLISNKSSNHNYFKYLKILLQNLHNIFFFIPKTGFDRNKLSQQILNNETYFFIFGPLNEPKFCGVRWTKINKRFLGLYLKFWRRFITLFAVGIHSLNLQLTNNQLYFQTVKQWLALAEK